MTLARAAVLSHKGMIRLGPNLNLNVTFWSGPGMVKRTVNCQSSLILIESMMKIKLGACPQEPAIQNSDSAQLKIREKSPGIALETLKLKIIGRDIPPREGLRVSMVGIIPGNTSAQNVVCQNLDEHSVLFGAKYETAWDWDNHCLR